MVSSVLPELLVLKSPSNFYSADYLRAQRFLTLKNQYITKVIDSEINDVDIVFEDAYRVLRSSTAALITSGTASLEAALLNVPQVVCYKTSFLSYIIAKYYVKIKYISLVNILNSKEVVSELIQYQFTKGNLIEKLNDIISEENITDLNLNYKITQNILNENEGSPSKKIANFILESI